MSDKHRMENVRSLDSQMNDRFIVVLNCYADQLGRIHAILVHTLCFNCWATRQNLYELAGVGPKDTIMQQIMDANNGLVRYEMPVGCRYQLQNYISLPDLREKINAPKSAEPLKPVESHEKKKPRGG
jgi:hypothetical protein